jgi:hypothetical protein
MTIPATQKNQISGSQNHGDSLLRQYQIIQLDFLPSGIVTANTQGIVVRNYLEEENTTKKDKHMATSYSSKTMNIPKEIGWEVLLTSLYNTEVRTQ